MRCGVGSPQRPAEAEPPVGRVGDALVASTDLEGPVLASADEIECLLEIEAKVFDVLDPDRES